MKRLISAVKYMVFSDVNMKTLDDFVEGFYKSAIDVFIEYGDSALQIIAECAFENNM